MSEIMQDPSALAGFLDKLKSSDANTRMTAWKSAGPMGAEAILPLGELACSSYKGIAKAAVEAMRVIAHYAARPGSKEKEAVSTELIQLADSAKPRMVRADALQLVGTLGDAKAIPTLTKLLADTDVQEDARMALERIPGMASLSALRTAQKQAAAKNSAFEKNLQQSLNNRKLTPKTVGIGNN